MAEPAGLGLSLDDLINKQKTEQGGGGYGKQRRQSGGPRSGGGGGGAGGRGPRSRPYDQQQGGRRGGGYGDERGGGYGGGRGGGGRGGGYNQRHPQQRQQQQQQAQEADEYRSHQLCWQEDSGEVVFRFMRTDLVRIDAAGNVTLDSGGHYNGVTLASLNDALNLIGIRVTCPSGDVHNGDWSISDGRSLTRFTDGVVLSAKGPQQAQRGRQLLQAFNNPNHAAQAAAMAASNAAATAAAIMPFLGVIPPGIPAGRQPAPQPGRGGGRSSVFTRLGGRQQEEGRFAPY